MKVLLCIILIKYYWLNGIALDRCLWYCKFGFKLINNCFILVVFKFSDQSYVTTHIQHSYLRRNRLQNFIWGSDIAEYDWNQLAVPWRVELTIRNFVFSHINLLYENKIGLSYFSLFKVLQDPVYAVVYGNALGSAVSAVGWGPVRIFHGRVSVTYHRHSQPHLVGQQRSA